MALSLTFYTFYKSLRYRETTKRFCSILQYAKSSSGTLIVSEDSGRNALKPVSEDLSSITPYFPNTFNLAAYVNHSETLKKLVDLNVNLSKIEKQTNIVNKILKLDFEKDIKSHILFINNFVGMDNIGIFLTKNPMILCETLENLQVRINYLHSKSFEDNQINRIITKNPFWLMYSTIRIDRRLGVFQKILSLSGEELRHLAAKQPKLITYNLHDVKCNLFVMKEEMGFSDSEVKDIVVTIPKLLMLNQRNLLERFNFIHNVMKITHNNILKTPEILMCRKFRIKQRHLFLVKLGRAQYDPKKENYVPVKSLIKDTDTEFCKNIAKCSVNDFNIFVKTL